MTDDWWRDFFGGLVVDFWKAAMPPEVTRAEAEFLVRTLRLAPGSRVLDVPCGAGRLAIELAARGCRMTGVDISPEFLETARSTARERGLEIEWRQSDMRDLPWESAFDAAFCGGSSFGFFDDEGNAAFLAAASRTLRPGGRFFADFKAAESILPNFRRDEARRDPDLHDAGDPADALGRRFRGLRDIGLTRGGAVPTRFAEPARRRPQ